MPVLATLTIESTNGVIADQTVINFAVRTTPGFDEEDPINHAQIVSKIEDWVNGNAVGASQPLCRYISQSRSRAADKAQVRLYDLNGHLDGSPHGSPFAVDHFQLGAPEAGIASFPNEVAMVCTLEAVGRTAAPVEVPDGADPGVEVDRPKQRRTGRLFFGPLLANTGVLDGGDLRPNTQAMTDLAAHTIALDVALFGIVTTDVLGLGIWSRVDASMYELASVFVDNAFDTQRRRGAKPFARITDS